MNANEVMEMKARIKEMQSVIDGVSNEAASKMLETMKETGSSYTGAELSALTENILTSSQAASAVRAVFAFKPEYQYPDYGYAEGEKSARRRRNRRPTTKFHSARKFADLDIKVDKEERKSYSIACDESGYPLVNAKPKCIKKNITTYQFVNSQDW